MNRSLALALVTLIGVTATNCSNDDNGVSPHGSAPPPDRYVNQATGDDNNAGSFAAPWATITHAVATADTLVTIHVAPGEYNEANGESFPIFVRTGQSLVGDVTHRGSGSSLTRIQGEGAFTVSPFMSAALVCSERVRVAGFYIQSETVSNFFAGILAAGVTMTIDHNTFSDLEYAAVGAVDDAIVDVHDNVMSALAYGVVVHGARRASIRNNVIDTGLYGIRAQAVDSLYAANNTIGTSAAGVQWFTGRVGVIRGNTFNGPGYISGAITVLGTDVLVRGNTFLAGPGIYIDIGLAVPDVGTSADPGMNDFSGVSTGAIKHDGQGTVMAIGNTWAHNPPQIGTDILISGTGTVVTQ